MTDKPSIRDFNYFDETAVPASVDSLAGRPDVPADMERRILALARERRRLRRSIVPGLAIFALVAWYVWDARDLMGYAFSPSRPPQVLGDVAELTPADIPVNAFVEVHGITEHRKLEMKLVRGVMPMHEERWFFRLLGSRGIFIETPPDGEAYGRGMELTVRGRAIDPTRTLSYGAIIQQYDEKFHPQERVTLRMIQVDVLPGEGKLPFVVLVAVLLALAGLNSWTLYRYITVRQRVPVGLVS